MAESNIVQMRRFCLSEQLTSITSNVEMSNRTKIEVERKQNTKRRSQSASGRYIGKCKSVVIVGVRLHSLNALSVVALDVCSRKESVLAHGRSLCAETGGSCARASALDSFG